MGVPPCPGGIFSIPEGIPAIFPRPLRANFYPDDLASIAANPCNLAKAWVKQLLGEQLLVKILVVAANIQMRTLKTEVEKGSM